MHNYSVERRANPRMAVNGNMTYYTCDSGEIHKGELEDMSLQGVRIWIDQKLQSSSQLILRVNVNDLNGIDEIEEMFLEFKATLLHRLPNRKMSRYGYGCIIDENALSENRLIIEGP